MDSIFVSFSWSPPLQGSDPISRSHGIARTVEKEAATVLGLFWPLQLCRARSTESQDGVLRLSCRHGSKEN